MKNKNYVTQHHPCITQRKHFMDELEGTGPAIKWFDTEPIVNISCLDGPTIINEGFEFVEGKGLTDINVDAMHPQLSSIDGVLFNKNKTFLIKYPSSKKNAMYVIPNTVSKIHKNAFEYCTNLENIVVGADHPHFSSIDGVLFNKNQTTLIKYPTGNKDAGYLIPKTVITIEQEAFARCIHLVDVIIQKGVQSIKRLAFGYCTGITNIYIPDTVTFIDEYAFAFCHKLTNVKLPNTITEVKRSTFYECVLLPEIIIPNSVTEIGKDAFYCCRNLQKVVFGSGIKNIKDNAFFCCDLEGNNAFIELSQTYYNAYRTLKYIYRESCPYTDVNSISIQTSCKDFFRSQGELF